MSRQMKLDLPQSCEINSELEISVCNSYPEMLVTVRVFGVERAEKSSELLRTYSLKFCDFWFRFATAKTSKFENKILFRTEIPKFGKSKFVSNKLRFSTQRQLLVVESVGKSLAKGQTQSQQQRLFSRKLVF